MIFRQYGWKSSPSCPILVDASTKGQNGLLKLHCKFAFLSWPFWCLGKNQRIKIERIIANYPVSIDEERYKRLIQVLSLYRLTMGQARQSELLEYVFDNFNHPEELRHFFINLSPFEKEKS